MRYTLLQLVQSVMSSMDADEINTISDTTESLQVVQIIKTVYDDIQSRAELPIQKTLFTLDASGNSAKPVLMTKPSTINNIEWIRYNKIQDGETNAVWTDMRYMCPDEFIRMTQSLLNSDADVDTMTHTANGFNITFAYRTDVGPTYYTSFDDNTIIFDAYDNEVDTTLQASKTQCFGELTNVFTESDTFIPNLQPQQFALLLSEAKALAWAELKQAQHQKAEQAARNNWVHLQTSKRNTPRYPDHSGPNYGRSGSGSTTIPRYLRNGA